MVEKGVKRTGFQEEVGKVVRSLRHEIYSGLRLPRERLVENALAEAFSVSRMVVRQALSQLQTEGLVEIAPYKGAMVASISRDRIYENYQVLSMMEGFAALLATEHLSDRDLEKLRGLVDKQRHIKQDNVRQWQKLNQEFHRAINLRCGNRRLIELIRQHVQFTTYWFLVLSVPGRIPRNIEEHVAIIEAFSRRNGELARNLMERHILGAAEYLVQHLQKAQPVGILGK